MATSREHDECDEGSFEYFLKEYLHSIKASHEDDAVKQSSKKYRHGWQEVHHNISNVNRRDIHTSPGVIPYLKYFILRGSHNDQLMVEFHEHQHSCYRHADSGNDDPFYEPYLADSLGTYDYEINELAVLLHDWLDKTVMPYFTQSQFSDLLSTIRFGHAYLTKLRPFVDQMAVGRFKKHFNRLSPRSKKLPHYIRTAFYPIYENLDFDTDGHSNLQLLTFDKECESYRVAFAANFGQVRHYYADFDSGLELILSAEDLKYFTVDVKNAPGNPDIRICFSSTDTTGPQPFASKLKAYTNGRSPILRKNIHTGAIAITKDYANHVTNVRHKKQKVYKLKDSNELWDDFRRVTVVKIVTIIEYMNINRANGEFEEIHKKNEVTIDTPLNGLLSCENCHRLAENLLKLSIDVIPNCLS